MVAITNGSKKVEQEMSYDAWGRRRNPNNWTYSDIPACNLINRGYTFHEHYDQLGLINMNRPKGVHDNTAKIKHRVGVTFGRVYDPVVGRFLSVDPVVGNPLSAQDYNGYSYCANNPLRYTDPDGYQKYAMPYFVIEFPLSNGFTRSGARGGGGGSSCYVGGYSLPGGGDRNGSGAGGYYYDWSSGTYRSSLSLNEVSFNEVNSNYVSRYGYNWNVEEFKQFIVNEQYKINSRNLTASIDGVGNPLPIDGNLPATVLFDKGYNDVWGQSYSDAWAKGNWDGFVGKKFYYPESSSFPKSLRRAFWLLSNSDPYISGQNSGFVDGYKRGFEHRLELIKQGITPGKWLPEEIKGSYDPVSPTLPQWYNGVGWKLL